MKLEIFMKPEVPHDRFPAYQTAGAAGFDLAAYLPTGNLVIPRGRSRIIATGLYFMIPEGYEVEVRSRSGLAFKHGLFVLNAPGTIDSDYRGEIRCVLHNAGPHDYVLGDGDRCAQALLKEAPRAQLKQVHVVRMDTVRGDNGEGSTGR